MSGYELTVLKLLRKGGYHFAQEHTLRDLNSINGKPMRLDFVILDGCGITAAIEVEGEQHYQFVKRFYKKRSDFLTQQENDRRKFSYCLAHRIPLYVIPYWAIPQLTSAADIFQKEFLVKSKFHNDKVWQQKTKEST